MTIQYIAGRVDTEVSTVCDSCVFDTWGEARQHLLSLAAGGGNKPATTLLREVETWTDPVFRSMAEGFLATRLFLYPAVLEDGVYRVACPRCLLGVEVTEVHHGDVAGPVSEEIGFVQTMPTTYRVYCEGDCEAESDECEDLFDALDGYLLRVASPPRDLLELVRGGERRGESPEMDTAEGR